MTDDGGFDPLARSAVGGPVRHVPVLREEAIAALGIEKGGSFLDATFGGGGYSEAILQQPGTKVLGLDRDPVAIDAAAETVARYQGRLTLAQAPFSTMAAVAATKGFSQVDGIVFDLGVSSMQLDEAPRGFSFLRDGPLDMRMSPTIEASAADIVAQASQEELADIFYYFGEERLARRIARAIVEDRRSSPFRTTQALASLIARIVPHKPTGMHPATRAFQALRIAVNDELGQLVDGLSAAEQMLAPGGRLAVVTFHSLEDRIAKQFLTKRGGKGQAVGRLLPGETRDSEPSFTVPRGQPIAPGDAELDANPRSRSAKLRFAVRTTAPAQPVEPALRKLATLPQGSKRT